MRVAGGSAYVFAGVCAGVSAYVFAAVCAGAGPRSMRVPDGAVPPVSEAASRSGEVITAKSPPSARKRSAASTFGPMLPGGNWPSAR